MTFLRAVKDCILSDGITNANVRLEVENFNLKNKITKYKDNCSTFLERMQVFAELQAWNIQ